MRLPRLLETIREKSSDEIVVSEAEPHEAHAAKNVISLSRRQSCRKSYPIRN